MKLGLGLGYVAPGAEADSSGAACTPLNMQFCRQLCVPATAGRMH